MANQLEPWRAHRSALMSPLAQLLRDFDETSLRSSLFSPLATAGIFGDMASELQERDDNYVLSVDIPGVDRKDIDVDISGNVLRVRAERRQESSEETGRMSVSECRYGVFERAFTLPSDVNPEKVEASYEDGVLHVVVPKAAGAKRHKVSVKEGGGLLSRILPGMKKESVPVETDG